MNMCTLLIFFGLVVGQVNIYFKTFSLQRRFMIRFIESILLISSLYLVFIPRWKCQCPSVLPCGPLLNRNYSEVIFSTPTVQLERNEKVFKFKLVYTYLNLRTGLAPMRLLPEVSDFPKH